LQWVTLSVPIGARHLTPFIINWRLQQWWPMEIPLSPNQPTKISDYV